LHRKRPAAPARAKGEVRCVNIERCPVCDGALQMTEVQEVWFNLPSVTVGTDGLGVDWERGPDYVGEDVRTRSIYCENDHTEAQIMTALARTASEGR